MDAFRNTYVHSGQYEESATVPAYLRLKQQHDCLHLPTPRRPKPIMNRNAPELRTPQRPGTENTATPKHHPRLPKRGQDAINYRHTRSIDA